MSSTNKNFFSKTYQGSKENLDAIKAKVEYQKKLTELLENIKQTSLGIDKQSRTQLYQLERKVCAKLKEVHEELKELVAAHNSTIRSGYVQGTLFDGQ